MHIAKTMNIVLLALAAGSVSAAPLTLKSPSSQVSLVELYTSEGCSSCPRADEWLSALKEDERLWQELVPVAFHVDYWDYIGWRDRFASPEHTQRQRDHSRAQGMRTVYTPGFMVAGREWRQWFSNPNLSLSPGSDVGSLEVMIDRDQLEAQFDAAASVSGPLDLHVAVLGFDLSTKVKAGENHGRTLEHDFVVLGHERVAMEKTENGYRAVRALPPASTPAPRVGLAAWVSRRDEPTPIQAVGGWLGAVE